MSSEDISKGSVWAQEINANLSTCSVGIVVLTPENLSAPWVLFEAGALFKAFEDRLICTVLLDIDPPVTGPLGQFQATKLDKDELRHLVVSIDESIDSQFDGTRVLRAFEKFYDDLDTELKLCPAVDHAPDKKNEEQRESEILAELLSSMRSLLKSQSEVSSQLRSISVSNRMRFEEEMASRVRDLGGNPNPRVLIPSTVLPIIQSFGVSRPEVELAILRTSHSMAKRGSSQGIRQGVVALENTGLSIRFAAKFESDGSLHFAEVTDVLPSEMDPTSESSSGD